MVPADVSFPVDDDVFVTDWTSARRARPVMGLPVVTSKGFPPSSESEGQMTVESIAIGVPQQ